MEHFFKDLSENLHQKLLEVTEVLKQKSQEIDVIETAQVLAGIKKGHSMQSGNREDLELTIALEEFVLDSYPSDHPGRRAGSYALALSLHVRYERWGDTQDLEKAIVLCRCLGVFLLGVFLLDRYEQSGAAQDLDESIILHRDVIDLMPDGHPGRSSSLTNLANSLITRFKRSGGAEDLDEPISLHHQALDLCPNGHPDRSAMLCNFANSLLFRFEQSGGREDLDESITLHRAALDLCPDGHPYRSTSLNNLANSLITRFGQSGSNEDLCESSALHRSALNLYPDGHHELCASLSNLAASLLTRFEQHGDSKDLDESISLHRNALDLLPRGHPGRYMCLNDLANTLITRFKQSGGRGDLDESISLYREALVLCPHGHPYRSTPLHNLANPLFTCFEQSGRSEDLDESISLFRDALNLLVDDPDRSMLLSNLASSLTKRFEQGGNDEDLDESISLNRTALDLRIDGHPNRSTSLNNLGTSLFARFQRRGAREDLDEAISRHRVALDLRPDGHPERSTSLNNLAISLFTRFQQSGSYEDLEESISLFQAALHRSQSGSAEDLDESISLYRTALDLFSHDHPNRFASKNNLANSLLTRFEQSRVREDLNQSISLHRIVLDLLPSGHPDRPASLSNLANALFHLCEQSGSREDLNEAISLHRSALNLPSDGHPDRSTLLSNLAISLIPRFEQSGGHEDLDESISLFQAALDLRHDGNSGRSTSLSNLATSLLIRFERTGCSEDVDESILLHRAALELHPDGQPGRAMLLSNLAQSLVTRFRKDEQAKDFEDAIQCLSLASTHPFSSYLMRLEAAQRWVSFARTDGHHSTLNAYRTAITVLQGALVIRPTLSAQHDLLASDVGYQTLAVDAASHAIENGDLPVAIELLEQGRGLLWSQMRGIRSPLDQLSEIDKALADRFADVSCRLEALITSSVSRIDRGETRSIVKPEDRQIVDGKLAFMRQLSEEQEGIIDEIRRVPGFDDFLCASSFEALQEVALEGPVIVINHSKFRCDALILLSSKDLPCVCVPLDRDWYTDASELCKELLDSRRGFGVNTLRYDEVLRRVMKVLWERVVSKVVQKLKAAGIAEGSRIWWCPTSVLCAFPFHAAGPFQSIEGRNKYLLDDYIPSYTPTLKSLIAARSRLRGGTEKFLFVGDARLPQAKKELGSIRRRRRVGKCLFDGRIPRDSVIQALQKAEWVHFTCHGRLDSKEPFKSSFALPGSKLTLLDIAKANLPNAEFAFLSACHTAEQSPSFAMDEVLHLAAAMQFCGFRSVIGTMWQLLDQDGPILADAVYMYLMLSDLEEGEFRFKRSAAAVREAALYRRNKKDEIQDVAVMTERWVDLIHIGA